MSSNQNTSPEQENKNNNPSLKVTFNSVEESVAYTQELFKTSTVLKTKKQSYPVLIRRISNPDGEVVATKENREPGQKAGFGDYVLVRLANEDSGEAVIAKDGQPDQWCATEKTVFKTYTVSKEIRESGNGVVYPDQSQRVHMVKLESSVQIQTSWGSMDGQPGDYLTNYDYDEAAPKPGNSYAIVAKDSWDATYEVITG